MDSRVQQTAGRTLGQIRQTALDAFVKTPAARPPPYASQRDIVFAWIEYLQSQGREIEITTKNISIQANVSRWSVIRYRKEWEEKNASEW